MAAMEARTFVLWLFAFSVFKSTFGALSKNNDLQIIVEEKPSDCQEYSRPGDVVHVHYTGVLPSGQIFDTSMKENRMPFKFQLGSGNVIKGWERGIQGMCPGEKRKLVIPPHLGYGKKGIDGIIPPDSILLFQVQLVGLERQTLFNQLEKFLHFAIWPASVLSLLYYLYRKINSSEAEERKSDRRVNKRKR